MGIKQIQTNRFELIFDFLFFFKPCRNVRHFVAGPDDAYQRRYIGLKNKEKKDFCLKKERVVVVAAAGNLNGIHFTSHLVPHTLPCAFSPLFPIDILRLFFRLQSLVTPPFTVVFRLFRLGGRKLGCR